MGAVTTARDGDRNSDDPRFAQIIGTSRALEGTLEQVQRVAPTDSTVLLLGETGTGKELVARAIHQLSSRRGRAFVKLNCAAIPTGLLESELFGHEKGAFTGAIAQKVGRFELAHRGTLFLDEVGDIPPTLQPKLLRVLQEQEFERLGSTRTQRVDVRLVAATNRDLEDMVERGAVPQRPLLPPERLPDRAAAAARPPRGHSRARPLLRRDVRSRRIGKRIDTIPPDTMAAFEAYDWPGNIRELRERDRARRDPGGRWRAAEPAARQARSGDGAGDGADDAAGDAA